MNPATRCWVAGKTVEDVSLGELSRDSPVTIHQQATTLPAERPSIPAVEHGLDGGGIDLADESDDLGVSVTRLGRGHAEAVAPQVAHEVGRMPGGDLDEVLLAGGGKTELRPSLDGHVSPLSRSLTSLSQKRPPSATRVSWVLSAPAF